MTHWTVKLGSLLLGALVAGCATVGAGFGEGPVSFSLKNSDAISGSANAAAPDDKPSSGQFF